TSIIVTIPHQTLLTGLGTAATSTGDTITAGQARRLACQAAILPAILDGDSEVLDLGRTSRFFKGPLRKALDLRDKECTTRGCHVPAAYCHGHHYRQPWAHGGTTSLTTANSSAPSTTTEPTTPTGTPTTTPTAPPPTPDANRPGIDCASLRSSSGRTLSR
ncbi:DUF222 domain-containing protein, partial [Nocardioides agariphilus]